MKQLALARILIITSVLTFKLEAAAPSPINISSIEQSAGIPLASSLNAQYLAYIGQARTGISSKNYQMVHDNLVEAAKINPLSVDNLLNGVSDLSYKNLKAVFGSGMNSDGSYTPGKNAEEIMADVILANTPASPTSPTSVTQVVQESTSTSSDIETLTTNLQAALESGDFSSALSNTQALNQALKNEPDMAESLQYTFTNNENYFNSLIVESFTPSQMEQILEAAGVSNENTINALQKRVQFWDGMEQLGKATNASDMATALQQMAEAQPTLTAQLFENGQPLDYATLQKDGYSLSEISSMAKAGGLSFRDIAQYVNGGYDQSFAQQIQMSTGAGTDALNSEAQGLYQTMLEVQQEGLAAAQQYLAETQSNITKIQEQINTLKAQDQDTTQLEQDLAEQQANAERMQEAIDVGTGSDLIPEA